MPNRSLQTFMVLSMVFVLGGCTEERALALKAGAEAFGFKAASAIDLVVNLHLRSSLGKTETEEVLIQRSREQLFLEAQRQAPAQLTPSMVKEAFVWLGERDELRRNAYSDYDRLKLAYEEFARSYKRLPEGSLFAARDVACSAALGARLVGYMAQAGKALASKPVPLVYEAAVSQKHLVATATDSAKTRNEQPLEAGVRSHVAFLKEQQRSNAEVIASLADAAESGVLVLEMIDSYDDVSIGDLMRGLRQILAVRESAAGLSSKTQMDRLDGVVAKLDSKPALAQALRLPLGSTPADCK